MRNVSLGNTSWLEYEDQELEEGWKDGQGNKQAREGISCCVIAQVKDKQEAIELTRKFVREIFAIPSCTYYDPDKSTLTMYCGDAGSGWYMTLKSTAMLCKSYRIPFYVNEGRFYE